MNDFASLLRATPVVLCSLLVIWPQTAVGEKPESQSEGTLSRPTLKTASVGAEVAPLRVGRLAADGTVVAWKESQRGCRRGCEFVMVWDAFEPDENGNPCCAEECGLARPGDRWFFGETFCNLYVTGDMQFDDADADLAERLELAWFWYVAGPGSGENCGIVVEFYEGFDDTCALGDNALGSYLGGVFLDFGFLVSATEYFYTDVDLCGVNWLPFDTDRNMAFNLWFVTYDNADPDTWYPATCAQPMLWGMGEDETIPDDRPGHQGPIQWDDSEPADWEHTVPNECKDYSALFDVCPEPLCAMVCFYDGGPPPNPAGDLDGDGDTDLSDLGIFLADWGCAWPEICIADLDGDGAVTQSDLGILLGDWG